MPTANVRTNAHVGPLEYQANSPATRDVIPNRAKIGQPDRSVHSEALSPQGTPSAPRRLASWGTVLLITIPLLTLVALYTALLQSVRVSADPSTHSLVPRQVSLLEQRWRSSPLKTVRPCSEQLRISRGVRGVNSPHAPRSGLPLRPGWPYRTKGVIHGSPAVADLDDDGRMEVVVGSDDGYVHVIRPNGTALPGSPVRVDSIRKSSFVGAATPAIADIDGDRFKEVVIHTSTDLVVLDHRGKAKRGWPVSLEVPLITNGPAGAPAAADLDGDGRCEIACGHYDSLFVFRDNGSPLRGWPRRGMGDFATASTTPTLADLDGDMKREIVFQTSEDGRSRLWAFSIRGSPLGGWPRTLGGRAYCSPAVGDIDGDGENEIVTTSYVLVDMLAQPRVFVFRPDGKTNQGWPVSIGTPGTKAQGVALGDIDRDGKLEVAIGYFEGLWPYRSAFVLEHDGRVKPGWPVTTGSGRYFSAPVIADLSPDPGHEVALGTGGIYASDLARLGGWNQSGTSLPGFPLQIPAFSMDVTPAVADLDSDGYIEIVVTAENGRVYGWSLRQPDLPSGQEWPQFHHDAAHTGAYSRQ